MEEEEEEEEKKKEEEKEEEGQRKRKREGRRGGGKEEDVGLQPAPPGYQQEAAGAIKPERLQSTFRSNSSSKTFNTTAI